MHTLNRQKYLAIDEATDAVLDMHLEPCLANEQRLEEATVGLDTAGVEHADVIEFAHMHRTRN